MYHITYGKKWVCLVLKYFTNTFNSIRKYVDIDKKEEVLEPKFKEELHKTVPNQKRFAAGIYLLKVSNRNTGTRCEICSKLTIKIPERRQ